MNPDEGGKYLERVLSGDVDAFRFIVRQHQHMAYSLAISMVKHRQDAEDVVQNAMIRAYKSIRTFRKEALFSSWLYKIVVNESLKYIKKNQKQKTFITIEEEHMNLGSTFNSALEDLNIDATKEMIHEVLLKMKPKEALVLKMHYLHENSLQEIHQVSGFSISNIKVLLHRARKSFMALYLQLTPALL